MIRMGFCLVSLRANTEAKGGSSPGKPFLSSPDHREWTEPVPEHAGERNTHERFMNGFLDLLAEAKQFDTVAPSSSLGHIAAR
jgi:hypothetical protein